MRESISTPILLLVSQSIFGSLYNTMPYVETWLSAFAALPPGLEIVWVCTHGATHWYILAKIDAIVGGTPRSFFLKNVVINANAKDVVKAEYESTAALYAAAPVNVPRPYTYGSFDSDMMRYVVIVRLIRLELTPTACWSSSRHGK
jgi:hypothetical protein